MFSFDLTQRNNQEKLTETSNNYDLSQDVKGLSFAVDSPDDKAEELLRRISNLKNESHLKQ